MNNNQPFYHDKRILMRKCAVPGCRAWVRPDRDGFLHYTGVCWAHRRAYSQRRYIKYFLPWFEKLPPERQKHYKEVCYQKWLRWVKRNINTRRRWARESYHRRKEERREKRNSYRRAFYAKYKR